MAHLPPIQQVHRYSSRLWGPGDTEYLVDAYCGRQPGGLWEGWLVFFPVAGGRTYFTDRETTQGTAEAVAYWAAGLTKAYLEGALDRALRNTPEARIARRLKQLERAGAEAAGEAADYQAAAAGAFHQAAELARSHQAAQEEEESLPRPEEYLAVAEAARRLYEQAENARAELIRNDPAGEHLPQPGGVHRLGEVLQEAGGVGALPVGVRAVARDGHQPDGTGDRIGLEPPGHLVAVDPGKPQVAEKELGLPAPGQGEPLERSGRGSPSRSRRGGRRSP